MTHDASNLTTPAFDGTGVVTVPDDAPPVINPVELAIPLGQFQRTVMTPDPADADEGVHDNVGIGIVVEVGVESFLVLEIIPEAGEPCPCVPFVKGCWAPD